MYISPTRYCIKGAMVSKPSRLVNVSIHAPARGATFQRLHASLGYVPPAEFEQKLWEKIA